MNPERRRKGITKAKRVAKVWKQTVYGDFDEEAFMQGHIKNRKKCSCSMCCNQRRTKVGRKHQKFLTKQEKLAEHRMNEDIKDMNNDES